MRLSLIVATGYNNVIGLRGDLPWPKMKADMKRFRNLTMNAGCVMMGRKTYESIIARNGVPLQGRTNLVLSHTLDGTRSGFPNAVFFPGIWEAGFSARAKFGEIFVIGGAEVYNLALPYADYLYLTQIHHQFPGDAFFPELEKKKWRLVAQEDFPADSENPFGYSFVEMVRTRVVK